MAASNLLTKNFLSLSFVQAINSLLQLLVIPFLISVVGADGFGVIAVAQVVMFYLSTFTEFGFNQTATRSIAIGRDDHPRLSRIFFTVYFTRLLLCIVGFGILLILVNTVSIFRENRFLYLAGFAFVAGQALLLNWFFQGIERMWYLALFTLLGRIIFVVAVFLFIREKADAWLYLVFLGAGSIVAGIASLVFVLRKFRLEYVRPGWGDIKEEVRGGWMFMLTNLSMNTCQYINIFILRIFSNDLVVGYFAIAERIYFVAKQILGIFSQAAYPVVCKIAGDRSEFRMSDVGFRISKLQTENPEASFFRQNYLPFLAVVFVGSFFTYVFAPQVLQIFIGSEAVHSAWYLRMFCIATVIICLNIPGTLMLLAGNQRRQYFNIYMAAGLINVVANVVLAYYFQGTGTVMAILITEMFITLSVSARFNMQGSSLRSE